MIVPGLKGGRTDRVSVSKVGRTWPHWKGMHPEFGLGSMEKGPERENRNKT